MSGTPVRMSVVNTATGTFRPSIKSALSASQRFVKPWLAVSCRCRDLVLYRCRYLSPMTFPLSLPLPLLATSSLFFLVALSHRTSVSCIASLAYARRQVICSTRPPHGTKHQAVTPMNLATVVRIANNIIRIDLWPSILKTTQIFVISPYNT